MKLTLILALITGAAFAADKPSVPQLLRQSTRPDDPTFAANLRSALGDPGIQKGEAFLGLGPDFVFAVEAPKQPVLVIDDQPAGALARTGQPNLWFKAAKLKPGISHAFYYTVDGAKMGGKNDVPAYGPDSYEKDGVPKGTLSDKITHHSKIYEGMTTDYWIYVPAQYDKAKPAALMVWQDGHGLTQRDGPTRAQIVFDNLTAAGKIPVMIQVMIDPGKVGDKAMRSIEYDTVSDKYARFLHDEILADVQAKYNIRNEGYSRAIAGNSSGGICSFNVAWFQPDQFSRVLSRIGSFTSIQWHPGEIDGGNVYPNKIRKEPKRNIRVWLQDGAEDLENAYGSWPLQNLQMANSLKMAGYDFHLSFGGGTHNGAHGNSELPEEMTWLWRDYDPAKTEQSYQMEDSEKAKPLFRVHVYNR